MPRLTEQEQYIVDKAAELWNLICDLPVEHDNDIKEFNRDIHNIQYRVMARPIRRSLKS
jgi:hypothetical protein